MSKCHTSIALLKVCVHTRVCQSLIDIAKALRLISSHGDCVNRLWRLTFDPENTLFSIAHALSLSPSSHLLIRLHILTFFFLFRLLVKEEKKKLPMICHALFPLFAFTCLFFHPTKHLFVPSVDKMKGKRLWA